MKKVTLIMITLIISMSLANADENTNTGASADNTNTGSTSTTEVEVEDSEEDLDEDSNEDSSEDSSEDSDEDSSDDSDKKGEEIIENRQEFRDGSGTGVVKKVALSVETKAKIKELMEAHKANVEKYKEALEAKELTREEFLAKVEELRKATHEGLVALVGNNEEAMRILGLKKDMYGRKIDNLIIEERVSLKEFINFKQNLKIKYKEKFAKSLGTKLDKLSNEKLEKVLARIDAAVEKTTSNEKLSQINKDKIMAQLEALKAIINEKLGVSEEDEELEDSIDELVDGE